MLKWQLRSYSLSSADDSMVENGVAKTYMIPLISMYNYINNLAVNKCSLSVSWALPLFSLARIADL